MGNMIDDGVGPGDYVRLASFRAMSVDGCGWVEFKASKGTADTQALMGMLGIEAKVG